MEGRSVFGIPDSSRRGKLATVCAECRQDIRWKGGSWHLGKLKGFNIRIFQHFRQEKIQWDSRKLELQQKAAK